MFEDRLSRDLFLEIDKIAIIDPHSHINPYQPTSQSLDDILGYHYYTELAHSAGMDHSPLKPEVEPRERVRAILRHLGKIDNTVQYSWFKDIARTFLKWPKETIEPEDADELFDLAEKAFQKPEWENEVLKTANVEKVFLTNEFDDDLSGFSTERYVPCLRTDTLVFGLQKTEVRERLAQATGIEVHDWDSVQKALRAIFEKFVAHGAKACAISLPPTFVPEGQTILSLDKIDCESASSVDSCSRAVFWQIANFCKEFQLPFDLMIGVNRAVYKKGVFQGQDLFDQRTSLIQYSKLFNSFPDVIFPVSVLTSNQNQELVSYSWIFPNVVTSGHWWYSNIPAYIANDARARLQAVPKTKQIGYYSDAYKLEFIYPKFRMYKQILASILANDFVKSGMMSENQAIGLARHLLRENVQSIFKI